MARRRRRRRGPHGIVVLDKPVGPTSFSVLRSVQRGIDAGKAGHAGTLDPAASGILVALFGEATKLSGWVMGRSKCYRATIQLGVATDTLDAEGTVTEEREVPIELMNSERISEALAGFRGPIMQRPPIYSALKRDGRSLMSRARAGLAVTVEPREVVCHDLDLESIDPAGRTVIVNMRCSKGFYVRALARDLGVALGVPAHLTGLRRTVSGLFSIDMAVAPDQVTPDSLLPLTAALEPERIIKVAPEAATDVRHGRQILAEGALNEALLVDEHEVPLALVQRTPENMWRVVRGFDFSVDKASQPI